MLLRIFFVLFVLASCASGKYDKLSNEALIDHKQCISFGFEEDSFEYKNCVRKLQEQRGEDQEV